MGSKYESGGHISMHDDSQFFWIPADDRHRSERFPARSIMFRKIAVIYYLTKDWQRDYGGSLIDCHTGKRHYIVPQFNSFVTFLVPRVHAVEALGAGSPARYTLFGWFSDGATYPRLKDLSSQFSTL